jgi:hypothetical protein
MNAPAVDRLDEFRALACPQPGHLRWVDRAVVNDRWAEAKVGRAGLRATACPMNWPGTSG